MFTCGHDDFGVGGGGWLAEDEAGGSDGRGHLGDEASDKNDGGGREGDEADGDYLEEMLWAIGSQVILKSVKSLENLKRVKTAKESLYGVENGATFCA